MVQAGGLEQSYSSLTWLIKRCLHHRQLRFLLILSVSVLPFRSPNASLADFVLIRGLFRYLVARFYVLGLLVIDFFHRVADHAV